MTYPLNGFGGINTIYLHTICIIYTEREKENEWMSESKKMWWNTGEFGEE